MKITVRDDSGGTLGAMQVRIKDFSTELERITVKVFGLHLPARPTYNRRNTQDVRSRSGSRKQFQNSLFMRMLGAVHIAQPVEIVRDQPTVATGSRKNTQPKTVEIKLVLPSLSDLPSLATIGRKLVALPAYKALAGTLAIVLIALVAGNALTDNNANAGSTLKAPGNSSGAPLLSRDTPKYHTILPAGKTIGDLGGWARVSPPDHNPVYAYVDHLGHTQLNVSQQPLPKEFKTNTTAQVAKLAQGFNATEKVTAKNDTTIYLGNSVNGPQSAIFTKANLLILIKTSSPLTNNQWVTYVSSLQ